MKISKLFHWLYAIVMLLPIFAIGISCGYAMFNKNAYKSYEYENNTITLTNIDEFKENNTYYFYGKNFNSSISLSQSNTTIYASNFVYNGNTYEQVQFNFYGQNDVRIYVVDVINSSSIISGNRPLGINFTFDYLSSNYTNEIFSNVVGFYKFKNNTLLDTFYYSVDKVTQSNMFNWAYDSFLVAPFSYIVNLFSMPTNSPVVMFMSYWLAISIIWLCFDLVMYVPLLVHRWLDKGAIE